MTPRLLAPSRRWPFVRLGLLTLTEAGFIALSAAVFRDVLVAAMDGRWLTLSSGLLLVVSMGAIALGWARSVLAEDVGMAYANDLRAMLAEHAVAAGGRRRLGALAVRMTGDLNPMREWASIGISEAAAGVATVIAGLIALGLAEAGHGAAIGAAVLACSCIYFLALWRPLARRIQDLRISRGQVAASAGDIVLSAAAIARYDAFERELRRFEKRAQRLRLDAVSRRRWASALDAPAGLAPALIVLLLLAYSAQTGGVKSYGDWAITFFGASLVGLGLRSMAKALDAYTAFAVAKRRMDELSRQIESASEPPAASVEDVPTDTRAVGKGIAFEARLAPKRHVAVARRQIVLVHAADGAEALRAVERAASPSSGSRLASRDISALSPRDFGRSVALVSPSVPLLRASLRRNLSLRRDQTSDAEMVAALTVVGLAADAWPLARKIDPALRVPDDVSQALLRLARAITHRPKVVLFAEPVFLFSPDLPALLRRVVEATGCAVVAASAAQPPEGGARVLLEATSTP